VGEEGGEDKKHRQQRTAHTLALDVCDAFVIVALPQICAIHSKLVYPSLCRRQSGLLLRPIGLTAGLSCIPGYACVTASSAAHSTSNHTAPPHLH
jgi:hypothetical protein